MILAAFIDLGMPLAHLINELKKLPLPEFRLSVEDVKKNAITAKKLDVICPDEHHHRDFGAIRKMITRSALGESVKSASVRIFERLADAEAQVHGSARDEVTFHEVGALDSIIDIVGIAIALEYFNITDVFHSAIPMTGGIVTCAHGNIPAMSPAASWLLKGRHFYTSDVIGELTTPTAAAVINALAENDARRDFTYEAIGSGTGTKDFETHPNIMRIFLGKTTRDNESVTVIETNIDDMNPQLFENLFEELFSCDGLFDAFVIPVTMKKSRPGFLLKAILTKNSLTEVSDLIFKNTTTIGLRHYDVERITLDRTLEKVATKYGEFSVKVARRGGELMNASCEYDECKATAQKLGVSVKEVMNHVNAEINKNYSRD